MPERVLTLYRILARWLLPRGFQAEYGADLEATVEARLNATHGGLEALVVTAAELVDLARTAVREWWWMVGGRAPGDNGEQARGGEMMGGIWRDLRYSFRSLRRAPAFTAVAVATLALGIGANTAIFSVVDGVLLQDLPYDEPSQLVTAWLDMTQRDGPVREWFTGGDFGDYRSEPGLFEEFGGWGGWGPTLTGLGEPTVFTGAQITAGMFEGVLRVQPVLGRGFTADEDRPGGPDVVLLAHDLWKNRFASDPGVIGRTLVLNETPWTVVGVMPEGFSPPFVPRAEIWAPIQIDPSNCGYGCFSIQTVGRLEAGVTLAVARQRASAVAARNAETHPESNARVGAAIFSLHDDMVRTAEQALWVLLGAVGFVLLIACTNVANLLLARGSAREGELAVRVALGAGRVAVLRQLLLESLSLAVLGGALGVALATWGTGVLVAMAPDTGLPGLEDVGLDARVLGFTALVTLGTGLLFGLVPAFRLSRSDVYSSVRSTGRGSVSGRLGGGLVVAQVGMALVLLVGAGLLIQSFQRLSSVDLGFEPDGVLTVSLFLPGTRFGDGPARITYYEELLSRLERLPGVTSAGATNSLPLAGNDGDSDFRIEDAPPRDPTDPAVAWVRRITRGYLETMGTEIVAGRGFTASDDAEAPRVVMINETLARRYLDWPGRDPLGARVTFGDGPDATWRTIVGVVEDTRHFGVRGDTRPAMYFPYRQVPSQAMTMVLRSERDPTTLAAEARGAVSQVDPALAASDVSPMTAFVASALATDRFVATVLGFFALVALTLAAVGLYGVVSYNVSRRMREMGIRLALGAAGADVRRLVVKGGMTLTLGGVLAGVVGAVMLTRILDSLLYDVPGTDPLTFVTMVAVLTLVAAAASWIPAWRAGRADPVAVMREE